MERDTRSLERREEQLQKERKNRLGEKELKFQAFKLLGETEKALLGTPEFTKQAAKNWLEQIETSCEEDGKLTKTEIEPYPFSEPNDRIAFKLNGLIYLVIGSTPSIDIAKNTTWGITIVRSYPPGNKKGIESEVMDISKSTTTSSGATTENFRVSYTRRFAPSELGEIPYHIDRFNSPEAISLIRNFLARLNPNIQAPKKPAMKHIKPL